MLGKTSLSFASPVNPFSEEVTSFSFLIITRHEISVFFVCGDEFVLKINDCEVPVVI
jgi:hypothetical protein